MRKRTSDVSDGEASPPWDPQIDDTRQTFSQMPFLIPSDHSVTAVTETILEGKTIACFAIGGENRLCLPQVLNSILSSFTLPQINAAYEELRVFSSLCGAEQLEALKGHGILPASASSCCLITKTNAERLCSLLLRHDGNICPNSDLSYYREGFRVSHECFGKGRGVFFRNLYMTAKSRAIQCLDCSGMFSPSEFVCHSHSPLENRTCHWGFDSANWRRYLMLSKVTEYSGNLRKRLEQELEDIKSIFIETDACHESKSASHFDKLAIKEEFNSEWNAVDGDSSPTDLLSLQSTSNIAAKDLKPAQQSSQFALSPFLHQGLPVLQDPDKVIPFNQSNRYDKSFTPNVSLAPEEYGKLRQLLTASEDAFPLKRQKMEQSGHFKDVTFPPSYYSSQLFSTLSSSPDNAKGNFSVDPVQVELFQLLKRELELFRCVLDGEEEMVSSEVKEKICTDYIQIREQHLALVDDVIQKQMKLEKELLHITNKVKSCIMEISLMQHSHKQVLSKCKSETRASLQELMNENRQLSLELDSLTSASKRSNLGLMKAKYRAQMQLYRRKCHSLHQSNTQLLLKRQKLQAIDIQYHPSLQ